MASVQMRTDTNYQVVEGVVQSIKLITRDASTRVAEFAFKHAIANGRKKVTAVHKANIMFAHTHVYCASFHQDAIEGKCLTGCSWSAAMRWQPSTPTSHMSPCCWTRPASRLSFALFKFRSDVCAWQITQDPTQFDMLVMPNLYGDILSDLAAGLIGGLGLTPR